MLDSFTCPFCNHTMPVIDSTYWSTDADFRKFNGMSYQDDDTYIYVRMNQERYLVLYYDDASTDRVLEVIQSNK